MTPFPLPPEPTAPANILYIGGWGRSGSTLLARILGEHPSMTFVGELRGVWQRGVIENRLCGCGEQFLRCEFWHEVGQRAFGGWGAVPTSAMETLRGSIDKPWWVRSYERERMPRGRRAEQAAQYVSLYGRVVHAIAETLGPDQIIVDSSKIPSFAWLLSRVPDLQLRVLHLIRDARGSVYSWQKQVAREDTADGRPATMLRYSPVGASARYVVYNRQAERLAQLPGPYVRARYEDLMADPPGELDRVTAALDLPGWDAGQLREGQMSLGSSHSVVGNPMRMHTGWIDVRPDNEWRERMSRFHRTFVTAATSPALYRYGYLGR